MCYRLVLAAKAIALVVDEEVLDVALADATESFVRVAQVCTPLTPRPILGLFTLRERVAHARSTECFWC